MAENLTAQSFANSSFLYNAATNPLPASPGSFARAMVSDATSPTYLGIYVSGGTVICPVFWNGTNWITG
jgi:hypothetical protein